MASLTETDKVERTETHVAGSGFSKHSQSPGKVGAGSCEVLRWCWIHSGGAAAKGVEQNRKEILIKRTNKTVS